VIAKRGERLCDARFSVVEVLGRGGEGVAYLVRDSHLRGARAVLKVLALGEPGDPEVRRRAVRLVVLGRRLDGVARVHELVQTDEGRPAFVCEFLSGETLRQVLDRRESLLWGEARVWLEGTLQALAHLHRSGVIHGDVKPANVVKKGSAVHLIDLGLARETASGVRGSIASATILAGWSRAGCVGTPGYMSPELYVPGSPVTAAADIYAVGAMTFEALTGKVSVDAAPPLEQLVPSVPVEVARIIQCSLAHNPGSRYRDASAMLAALEGAERKTLPSQPRPGPAPVQGRPATGLADTRAQVLRAREDVRQLEDTFGRLRVEEGEIHDAHRAAGSTPDSLRRLDRVLRELSWVGRDRHEALSALHQAEQAHERSL
jgi:serine/threonine-protein kinase